MKTSTTRFPIITMAVAVAMVVALTVMSSCNGGGSGNPTNPGPRELNSGDFGPGATFQHTFANAGTYNYHCIHHGPMTGTVTVDAGAAGMTADVNITSFTAPFPAASVKPGGTVTWTNNTTMVHTVTSN
jgi:plastocyanin